MSLASRSTLLLGACAAAFLGGCNAPSLEAERAKYEDLYLSSEKLVRLLERDLDAWEKKYNNLSDKLQEAEQKLVNAKNNHAYERQMLERKMLTMQHELDDLKARLGKPAESGPAEPKEAAPKEGAPPKAGGKEEAPPTKAPEKLE